MLAKDGLGMVAGSFVVFFLSGLVWILFPHPLALGFMIALGVFTLFNLFFFRDPDRKIPKNPRAVLSPADGKVIRIANINEPDYFNREVQRISIFLSIFNVHVNRTPISGEVNYFAYHTGKFRAAFNHKASMDNEQTVIGIAHQQGYRVLFKQIAGLIARRIICHLREGNWSNAGDRMGMIRYGSRVDVFLPFEAKILVRQGQSVTGGETILATFPEEGDFSHIEEQKIEMPLSDMPS